MDTFFDRTTEKRARISWGRKAVPLKSSTLFNKIKHSKEWHQSIDVTAGVLHPSDSKFPAGFLRNHTDIYLKKKHKINQADTDIRLAILIYSHDARDIAIAAAAYAMTAKSLRALLPANLNVMQGSYWGLKTWLQCLIAANDGNPTSVTDLEAILARKLLPFATHGQRAAEWYLVGMCRALREVSIPNLSVLPEFSVLTRRAIADHSTQLEGFRLRCGWTVAYEAVLWMMELARTSPAVTPPGHLLPEHILDSQFPTWRMWSCWTPTLPRIQMFASMKSERLALVYDFMAFEGPDIITGAHGTLADGLIAQYNGVKNILRWRGLVIEVPDGTKEGLRKILQRVVKALEAIIVASDTGYSSMSGLFRDLLVARPIATGTLDLFEATCKITYTLENDIYNTVRELYNDWDQLGGQHILALQNLVRVLDNKQSEDLRKIMLQDWLRIGIENCLHECQKAVRKHIDKGLQWTHLALEYHAFCTILMASEHHWPLAYQAIKVRSSWLFQADMKRVVEIYEAAQVQRSKHTPILPEEATTEHETPKAYKQTKRGNVPLHQTGEAEKKRHPFEEHIEAYCIDRLLAGGTISHSCQQTMTAILNVWESTSNAEVCIEGRELAMLVSRSEGMDLILRCRCLSEIATGKDMRLPGTFVKDLLTIVRLSESNLSQAIVALTNLLVNRKARTQCWRDLIYMWLERQQSGVQDVLDFSLQTMTAAEWLMFMRNIEALFADLPFSSSQKGPTPSILQPALLGWTNQVTRYAGTLTQLEAVLGESSGSIRYLLTCEVWGQDLLRILECLQKLEGEAVEVLMQKVVGMLSLEARNHVEIGECLLDLAIATPEAIHTCFRVWDAKHGQLNITGLPQTPSAVNRTETSPRSDTEAAASTPATISNHFIELNRDTLKSSPAETALTSTRNVPLSVVEVMVAGWIQSHDINECDKTAIASIAGLLGICVEAHSASVWKSKLIEAMAFWQDIEHEFFKEVTRLEEIQKSLKAKDPKGTALLLQEFGIPDNSLLDEEILNLPAGIIDMVERIGEAEVEIGFPMLAYTQLQRWAMGIPTGANSLLLRLSVHNVDGMPPSFCIHFNNDKGLDNLEHSPWICSQDSSSPQENFCTTPQTAFVWQLNRIVHTQLRIGNLGVADLYKVVKDEMKKMGHTCISCGTSHSATNAQLRRATPCNVLSCARLWYQLPLDVRIPEIKTDTFAVDAMLTSVHAAAMSGRPELLPSCPIGLGTVKTILNCLPSLTVISHAVNISAVLKSYHKDAEKLISWACVHHRGYIATATGLCKIPTMPAGTHQFVLANASPGLESDFVSKLMKPNSKTTVLFHGTTFERLPAILVQGLKVCSGTSLQRTGAAHGKGIYMAEEPATSLTYSSAQVSWRNSGLTNMRLLLGCEVIGGGRSVSSGIHVISDETSVMVRYIFFLKSSTSMPIASHIVPAMASSMSALRTGAV